MNSSINQVCKLYVDLKSGNIGEMLINYWYVLVSYKLFHQSGVVFRKVENVWRKRLGKCKMYIEVEYPDFFVLPFHLHQF